MARRVALARAIALDPELVMYDEPFAGLDPISLGTAAQLIRQLNDAMGLTTILVSHDLEATFELADHVIILGPGTIAAQGTPDEVRHSSDPLVHQFVNALPVGPVPFHYPGPMWRRILVRWTEGCMSWYHLPTWAFAVRRKLADVGLGRVCSRALLRLFPAVWQRPGLVRDQVHFLGNYSLAIITVSGLLWGSCWPCRATTRCRILVRPRRWGNWWR